MKKFLFRVILFISFFIIIDKICGYFLQKNRPIDYKLFLDSKNNFFSNINNIDILIIGDSHIADALDPRTIESRTTFSAYNLGIYHSFPFENYYVTKAALEHLDSKPKMIVLGTNPVMFERELSKGKYTPLILPKLNSLEFLRNSDEGFESSFFFNIFREKYLFKSLLNNLLGKPYKPTRIIEDVYNGHCKFYNQIPGSEWSNFTPRNNTKIKIEQVDYFLKTIELALKNNIDIIIAHPPIYKENLAAINGSDSYKYFCNIINEITEKYELKTYYDYPKDVNLNDTSIFQKNDFLNSQHLNYKGSLKFSNGFSAFLNRLATIKARTNNNVYKNRRNSNIFKAFSSY